MNTIVEIVKDFIQQHLKVNIYEFNAIDRDDEENHFNNSFRNKIKGNSRLTLYKRYLPKIFNNEWEVDFELNNAIVKKIK